MLRVYCSVEEFLTSKKYLGDVFTPRETWDAWITFAKACFGERLTARELEIWQECTGRESYPSKPFGEAWICVGRRGGKSRVLSALAVYCAFAVDWRPCLSKGERAYIPVVAADREQARVIFRYIQGIVYDKPWMKKALQRDTQHEFEFSNGVDIAVMTASYRTIRGRTVVAALFDEIAFWKDETSSNPDEEIVKAIRPAMATARTRAGDGVGPILFCASSPFRQRGVLFSMYKRYYGSGDSHILYWKAPSWIMNPSLDQDFLERERKLDPVSFRTEYAAEFRRDSDDFLTEELLDQVTDFGVTERPPRNGLDYRSFIDPSGGRGDSFVAAIAHEETGTVVIDRILEFKPPFDPREVVSEISKVLKEYGIRSVRGDRYGGEWPRQAFREFGIDYEVHNESKTELYRNFLPMITGRRVVLLDNGVLRSQLLSLERKVSRSGAREVIDHPRGQHDDVANAVAGVCSVFTPQQELYIGFA